LINYLDSINSKSSAKYRDLIAKSNEGWEIYSESMCQITDYNSRFGAQGGNAFYLNCKTDFYNKRIEQLKENLEVEFNGN